MSGPEHGTRICGRLILGLPAYILYSVLLVMVRAYGIDGSRNNGEDHPEFRIPILMPGSIFLAVGLFWYGYVNKIETHIASAPPPPQEPHTT